MIPSTHKSIIFVLWLLFRIRIQLDYGIMVVLWFSFSNEMVSVKYGRLNDFCFMAWSEAMPVSQTNFFVSIGWEGDGGNVDITFQLMTL